jgi:hypothetical protein
VGDRIRVAWRGPVEAVDQRHAEGERLARPGWRLDEDVLTSEDVPDTKTLHREGLGDAALGEPAHDRRDTPRSANDSDDICDALSERREETEPLGDPVGRPDVDHGS